MNTPLVSIIIVNWNGRKWLDKCLRSLEVQTYKHFEIIFVDNASSDDSIAYVRENFPEVTIVETGSNLGFAGGNIAGLEKSSGDYILLLNNDTWVTETYLENLVEAFDIYPDAGSVQSKIILMNDPGKLDVCGSYWTSTTFLYHYGYAQNQNDERFNRAMPFFSNKGASMMVRREVIEKIGFLDADFWSYYEETDLCHRIWLAGYECWYYPKAVMYHAMGGTSVTFHNSKIQFHNFKNKLLSFLKNFQMRTLLSVLPIYLILNIALGFFWLLQGKWRHFLALYQAIWWNVSHFAETYRKRVNIQKLRVVPDNVIFNQTKVNPELRYYYYLLMGLEKYSHTHRSQIK
jgi:GT2 family glycosyltransferase